MYLTEDEAKERWCPMVRFFNPNHSNALENRWMGGSFDKCIASQCMMWRQYELSDEAKLGIQSAEEARIAYGLTERGYCGLAGKPE